MKLSFLGGWTIPMLVGGAGVVAGLWFRGEFFRQRAILAGLARDSVEAAMDTTRRTTSGELAVTLRRAIQAEIKAGQLANELKMRPVVRSTMTATVKELDTVWMTPQGGTGDTVLLNDSLYSAPYHVRFLGWVPPRPLPARITFGIRLDTATLSVATLCGPPRDGIAPATLALTGPSWLSFTVDSSQITPLACNPKIVRQMHGTGYYVVRVAAATGLGLGLYRLARALLEKP